MVRFLAISCSSVTPYVGVLWWRVPSTEEQQGWSNISRPCDTRCCLILLAMPSCKLKKGQLYQPCNGQHPFHSLFRGDCRSSLCKKDSCADSHASDRHHDTHCKPLTSGCAEQGGKEGGSKPVGGRCSISRTLDAQVEEEPGDMHWG